MAKVYKVGDWVWYATYESREEQEPCPVCYGNKIVILVLGNGDEVEVECQYCQRGFQGSSGYVTEYVKTPRAEHLQVTKRRIEDGSQGEEIEYYSDHYCLNIERMFDTEEEAVQCANSLEEVTENKPKYKQEKSYTWNAGYHMKAAKDNRREAEYHEAKAKICKSRSKE